MPALLYPLEIYTYHIDFSRHVSNVVYIQWMEIGRLKLLEAADLAVPKMAEMGVVPVLVETQIKYKRPFFLGESVTGEVSIVELSKVSAIMRFRFLHANGDVGAEGTQKGLFCSIEGMKPYRIPPEMRTQLEPFVLADVQA